MEKTSGGTGGSAPATGGLRGRSRQPGRGPRVRLGLPMSAARPPFPSPTGVNIDGCVTEETGKIFEYTRDGNTTLGVIMGKGPAGAVVSYERRGKVCDWLPLADRLVDAGHRVLLFKRNNMVEPEEDTVAMAERLREEGVTKVFLIGGSMGGRLSASRPAC